MIYEDDLKYAVKMFQDFNMYKELGYTEEAAIERTFDGAFFHDLFTSVYGADYYTDDQINDMEIEIEERMKETIQHSSLSHEVKSDVLNVLEDY